MPRGRALLIERLRQALQLRMCRRSPSPSVRSKNDYAAMAGVGNNFADLVRSVNFVEQAYANTALQELADECSRHLRRQPPGNNIIGSWPFHRLNFRGTNNLICFLIDQPELYGIPSF